MYHQLYTSTLRIVYWWILFIFHSGTPRVHQTPERRRVHRQSSDCGEGSCGPSQHVSISAPAGPRRGGTLGRKDLGPKWRRRACSWRYGTTPHHRRLPQLPLCLFKWLHNNGAVPAADASGQPGEPSHGPGLGARGHVLGWRLGILCVNKDSKKQAYREERLNEKSLYWVLCWKQNEYIVSFKLRTIRYIQALQKKPVSPNLYMERPVQSGRRKSCFYSICSMWWIHRYKKINLFTYCQFCWKSSLLNFITCSPIQTEASFINKKSRGGGGSREMDL